MTVLYAEHVKEPGGASSCILALFPVTTNCLLGCRSDGQPGATMNKWKQTNSINMGGGERKRERERERERFRQTNRQRDRQTDRHRERERERERDSCLLAVIKTRNKQLWKYPFISFKGCIFYVENRKNQHEHGIKCKMMCACQVFVIFICYI